MVGRGGRFSDFRELRVLIGTGGRLRRRGEESSARWLCHWGTGSASSLLRRREAPYAATETNSFHRRPEPQGCCCCRWRLSPLGRRCQSRWLLLPEPGRRSSTCCGLETMYSAVRRSQPRCPVQL